MLTKKKPEVSRSAPRVKKLKSVPKLAKSTRRMMRGELPNHKSPQSFGQLITENLKEHDAVYFYAPNFFANFATHLKNVHYTKGWRGMFSIGQSISVLARSQAFRRILAEYQIREFYPTESLRTHHTDQSALILIFAAMFYNPINSYIKVYRENDNIKLSWADNDMLFPELAWDALCKEVYGFPAQICTVDEGAPFDLMLNSGYQEISWRIFRMKHSFMATNKTDEIKRQGSRERINDLSVGDRVIVPFSCVARLEFKKKGYSYLTLERGARVHTRKKQTMKATDGLGDWTRHVEVVEDTSAYDRERSSTIWEVMNVCWKGGGTGHGSHDVYPDGLHLTLRSTERKEIISFYVSGAFTCQIDSELVIVE